MPAITYREWSGGLDRRLPLNIQDANKLWTLKNAYVTAGKKIAKRPGLRRVTDGLSGSVGLESLDGGLCVFAVIGSSFVAPTGVVGLFNLTEYNPVGLPVHEIKDILYAKMFQGYPYIVALHQASIPRPPPPPGWASIGGTIVATVPRHHYVDTNPVTLVTDANCPHGASVTVLASRVFSTGGQVVRYCKAGDARDWTTASDAGFLPTSLQQDTKAACVAVGSFNDALTVLFEEGSQIWTINVDPTANSLRQRMFGVGTRHPLSLAGFFRDLVFASSYGVRSLAVQENVDRVDESDVGVPIDSLLTEALARHEAVSTSYVRGMWVPQLGQYWLLLDGGGFSRVFAYTFSRSSRIACWSEYTFPVLFTGMASQGGKLYLRTASTLYELDPSAHDDDGTLIDVDVQMAFQDAKLPGVEKQWYGADFVFSGQAEVSYLYEPSSPSKETITQLLTGDTRSGQVAPVEVCSAAIAPRFRHSAREAFSVDLVTLYFNALTATT